MRLLFAALAFALMAAGQAPLNCPGKLSEEQLVKLIGGKVPEPRLLQFVNQCGIGFAWSEKVRARLKGAGATPAVLSAVESKAEKPARLSAGSPAKPVVPPAQTDKTSAEISYWNSIKDETDPRFFQSYLARYPSGIFADVAKLRLRAASPEAGSPKTGSETAALPKAGTTNVHPKDGLAYAWIPPGTFTMGCSPGDGECFKDENPAHQVTITKGFWIGQTDVTQEAYQRVKGANPSHFRGPKLPVDSISWNEAKSYCEAAGMRLPTEAEWEYAARAGITAIRYGDIDQIAWYSGNSGSTTHEVSRKEPNAWNLYDMLGNVWQWTADWYDAGTYARGDNRDPQGPPGGQVRVLRGGSFDNDTRNLRASFRSRVVPGSRDVSIGFRCAGN